MAAPIVAWMEKLALWTRGDMHLARCLKMCRAGQKSIEAVATVERIARESGVGRTTTVKARRTVRREVAKTFKLNLDALLIAEDLVRAGVRSWVMQCPELTWEHWVAMGPILIGFPESAPTALFMFHMEHENPFTADAIVALSEMTNAEAEHRLVN